MLRVNVDQSSAPAYQQVIQAASIEIISGRLKEGDRSSADPELAKILKLNPNTVAKAYYALEKNGLIESGRGAEIGSPRPPTSTASAAACSRGNQGLPGAGLLAGSFPGRRPQLDRKDRPP
jgi:DNA-binding transcriptional MocR family regulator